MAALMGGRARNVLRSPRPWGVEIESHLVPFVRESNRIEGITREPTATEIDAIRHFVALPALYVPDVQALVAIYDPKAVLRRRVGLDAPGASHTAPPGGPLVDILLTSMLDRINRHELSPYEAHIAYKMLHPFTNGNGWSGRAIWLWQRGGDAPRGFLHQFYYETLVASARRSDPIGGAQNGDRVRRKWRQPSEQK